MFLNGRKAIFVTLIAVASFAAVRPSVAKDELIPLPKSKPAPVSCTVQYSRAADAYWPVVGDIIRFNAMFENYAELCAKADPIQFLAVRPLAKKLRALTDQDIAASYDVMERIIRRKIPATVSKSCRNDIKAQDAAVAGFHAAMNDQAHKAEKRLARSVGFQRSSSARICHNLTALRRDFEKRTKGRMIENPLFEIASLRRTAAGPFHGGPTKAYKVYRETLGELRREQAAATKDKKKKG